MYQKCANESDASTGDAALCLHKELSRSASHAVECHGIKCLVLSGYQKDIIM